MPCLDSNLNLTVQQAYAAMLEFLRMEFELSGRKGEVHLGGLLSEMEVNADGQSADPGAMEQFNDAVAKVLSRGEI